MMYSILLISWVRVSSLPSLYVPRAHIPDFDHLIMIIWNGYVMNGPRVLYAGGGETNPVYIVENTTQLTFAVFTSI